MAGVTLCVTRVDTYMMLESELRAAIELVIYPHIFEDLNNWILLSPLYLFELTIH